MLGNKDTGKSTKYLLSLPIVILLCMVVIPLITLMFGKTIKLRTRPYDPTDIFRGDYIRLEYDIGTISMKDVRMTEEELERTHKIYVALKEDNGIHVVDYVTDKKPSGDYIVGANRDRYVVRGGGIDGSDRGITLDYGIDTFFVEENTGYELEDMARKGDLIAEVRIFGGHAILRSVKGE